MDLLSEVAESPTGAVESSTLQPPCPLNDLPQNLHQYIHGLEKRIGDLENLLQDFAAKQQQSREAMKGLGKIVFNGPGKMFISVLPKDAQAKLQEFFGGEEKAVTQ